VNLRRVLAFLWLEAGTLLLIALVVAIVLGLGLGVAGPGGYDGMP